MPRERRRDRFIKGQRAHFHAERITLPCKPGYTSKCPLCGEHVTKAVITITKHVGKHIRAGDIKPGGPAASLNGILWSYRGEL